jgi:hypothetical protein
MPFNSLHACNSCRKTSLLKKGAMNSKIKERFFNHNPHPKKCATPEKDVTVSHSDTWYKDKSKLQV